MFRIICLAAFAGAVVALALIALSYFKDKSLVIPYIIFFVFIAVFGVSAFLHIKGVGSTAEDPSEQLSQAVEDPSTQPSQTAEDTPQANSASPQGSPQPSDDPASDDTSNIVFDAQRFMFIDSTTGSYLTVSEKELVEMIGEPEKIDEWNYRITGMAYPIRSLSYDSGNYVYEFNNDRLIRIQIFESIPYGEKTELVEMFNLRKESTATIVDTGVTYRVYDCIANDLWCTFNADGTLFSTYISYSDLFG